MAHLIENFKLKIIQLSLLVVVGSLCFTKAQSLFAQPTVGYLSPQAIVAKSPEINYGRCFFSEASYQGLWIADTIYSTQAGKISMNVYLWTIDTAKVVVAVWSDTLLINIGQIPVFMRYQKLFSNKNGTYAMEYKANSDRYIVTIRPRKRISKGIVEETVLDTLEVEDIKGKSTLVKTIPAINCW